MVGIVSSPLVGAYLGEAVERLDNLYYRTFGVASVDLG